MDAFLSYLKLDVHVFNEDNSRTNILEQFFTGLKFQILFLREARRNSRRSGKKEK